MWSNTRLCTWSHDVYHARFDLSKTICQHNVKYQSNADDAQIYILCDRDNLSIKAARHKLQECIADVCIWMNNSPLRLNEAKTEFDIVKQIITDVSNFKLKVGTSLVHSSNQVKILGVILDSKMTLDPQISTTCRSTYMQIRKINRIRKFLTTNAVKTLVQSKVIVRLDYCNSLYHGLIMKLIKKL